MAKKKEPTYWSEFRSELHSDESLKETMDRAVQRAKGKAAKKKRGKFHVTPEMKKAATAAADKLRKEQAAPTRAEKEAGMSLPDRGSGMIEPMKLAPELLKPIPKLPAYDSHEGVPGRPGPRKWMDPFLDDL